MKKTVALVLLIVLSCSFFTVYADNTVDKAKTLYDLGLLKGVGNSFSLEGLELSRNAKRVEICVTVVRMLGKEEKALYQKNGHPFGDVPAWASDYVGWLYENYLVNGVSDTIFGTEEIATTKQFCAMILRVLGYSEKEGHFAYDNAVKVALEKGLLTDNMAKREQLIREDMVIICYNALKTNIRNSKRTLITKLCDEAAVDKTLAGNSGILKKASISDSFPNVPENIGNIRLVKEGNLYRIIFDKPVEEYGLRVYMMGEDGVLKALGKYGTPMVRKGDISYPDGSAAGYVSEMRVIQVEELPKCSFIVVKTTSEGEIFDIVGKSSAVSNQEVIK